MASEGTERRLAAILSADVVGYSRLMAEDEAGTVRTLTDYREEIAMLVRQHRGRVVDTAGDSVLAEFATATEAVACAVEIQGSLEVRNSALPTDRRMEFRIGVHLGEVRVEEERLYGDGVNVAARLEALSEPRGICISGTVHEQVESKLDLPYRDLGGQSLKNIPHPVRAFSILTDSSQARRPSRTRSMAIALAGMAVTALLAYGIYVPNRAAILSSIYLTAPLILSNPIEQQIGFATTTDGVRIAYATTGDGPPVVFVLGWISHLERGLTSPLYDRDGFIRWNSRRNLFVRYDGRGFGLSDREVDDFSLDARVRDLEAVVDALNLERFALYAVSAGGPAAVAYVARHPERVSRLILQSTYARLPTAGPSETEALTGALTLMRSSWESPIVRSMMTTFLAPDADDVSAQMMNEFLRVSGDGEAVAGFGETTMEIDATRFLGRIRAPTLVIHGDEDTAVPLEGGRHLASLIPDARLEIVRGMSHIEPDAALRRKVMDLTAAFLGEDPTLSAGDSESK